MEEGNLENMVETANNPYIIEEREKGWLDYLYMFGRGMTYIAAFASAVVGAVGCSSEDPDPIPPGYPVAELVISPSPSAKENEVTLDASASQPGDSDIIEARFDFDGDGNADYTESESSAPDGNFDLQTTHTYSSEGDYAPTVTVMNRNSKETMKQVLHGVGYGTDKTGAIAYIDQVFADNDHYTYRDWFFQLLNPSTGQMVGFTADIEGEDINTAESTYVIYDSSTLSQEQLDTLAARQAEEMYEPKVRVVEPVDSPQTIEFMLGF